MLKRIALIATVTATAALALTSTAGADSGRREQAVEGARCVQAGVGFLADNSLLAQAARAEIDYDTIDSDIGGPEGPINTDLDPGSFLPLDAVIGLHFTNPELFDWCGGDEDESWAAARGARCVHAGVQFLLDNNLLISAALQQVDYDTIDSDSGGKEGLINTDLPSPAFLPLDAVIDLHFDNPRLFDWCVADSDDRDEQGKDDDNDDAQKDDDDDAEKDDMSGQDGRDGDAADDDDRHDAADDDDDRDEEEDDD